jgi:2-polyprenyl-6-methoxyphenol hydroxylase-like FAD-dependent oxidoreductase
VKTYTSPDLPLPALGRPGFCRSPSPALVIGAGPVGLTVAIDLAQRGVSVVVLDDDGVTPEKRASSVYILSQIGRVIEVVEIETRLKELEQRALPAPNGGR